MSGLKTFEGFDAKFANAVVAADTLLGGDIGSEKGGDHFIADTYPKGEFKLPLAYRDERAAALRKVGGIQPGGDVETAEAYAKDYGLLEVRHSLADALGPGTPDHRRHFMDHMGRALDVMTKTALAIAKGVTPPYYEDRRNAVVDEQNQNIVNTISLRDELEAALAEVGFGPTEKRDLRTSAEAWKQARGVVSPEQFAAEVERVRAELLALLRRNMFEHIDFDLPGHDPHLADIQFDGMRLETLRDVHYTGSNTYEGSTNPDGTPALKALFEYNLDHPIGSDELPELIAHEIMGGHYTDGAMSDLRFRAGQLGVEGVVHTMCTAETAIREGVAQNALALAYGGTEQNVIDALGPDQRVQFAMERMQDAGKKNASILRQICGLNDDQVKWHLAVSCVLSDPIVKKLSGLWAKHPILGPMYGPAYWHGYHVVREAILRHGPHKVMAAALHQFGYTDIQTFPEVLAKAA